MFEAVVEAVRETFSRGIEPLPYAIFLRNNRPMAIVVLLFRDNVGKQIVFTRTLPDLVRKTSPESCIFVIPSRMSAFNVKTGEKIADEDVMVIYEVSPVEIRIAVVNREGKAMEFGEEKSSAPLLEEVRRAMEEVWGEIV